MTKWASLILCFLFLAEAIQPTHVHAFDLDPLGPHNNPQAQRLHQPPPLNLTNPWMVIVGDSGTTGAATGPETTAEWWNLAGTAAKFFLWENRRTDVEAQYQDFPNPEFFNITDPVQPLTRVFYSDKEFRDAKAKSKHYKLNLEAKGSMKLDVEEYGFGYLVGRRLGIDPQNIILVGKDGTRISTIAQQFQRIYETGATTLPPVVFISFTANEMCHPNIFKKSIEDLRADYLKILRDQLGKVVANNKPHPNGTRIIALAPLDAIQVFTDKNLLRQEVDFHGAGKVSCGSVRDGSAAQGELGKKMLKQLESMCRAVLSTRMDDHERIDYLRRLHASYVSAWPEALAEVQALSPKNLTWEFAEEVRQIPLEVGDLANDCFHPSVKFHAKIARTLLRRFFNDQE